MPKTTIFIVSDETENTEKVKNYASGVGATVHTFHPNQWREGLENNHFRQQLVTGMPSLIGGSSTVEGRNNVLQFPTGSGSHNADGGKVATMDELESKAIENAIMQFKGNLTEAAKALGIGRATLYRKVKQYQIDPNSARKRRAA
jgi:transcriptional regulator with GAF, ATPase, and Fis domain